MAKKEKKNKAQKQSKKTQKQAKKQAVLVPEHQRPVICPPDKAGRGLGTRIFGYVCRCFVVMCLIWALMMFFGAAFEVNGIGTQEKLFEVCVTNGKMLLFAAFATAAFGLLFYGRYAAIGGVAVGAAGIAIFMPNFVKGALALVEGFLCRVTLAKLLTHVLDYDRAECLDALKAYGEDGMLVMALVLAAIFVPLLVKRVRPVIPTVVCMIVIVPICVFNVASGGLGAGMLIASIAAVLVMWAYDKMFRRRVDADKYDTKLQMFSEEGVPQYPEEYLQKMRAKQEKKLQKKLARQAKKQKKSKDKTVEQEISDYLAKPQKKAKPKKQRLTEQEKKQQKEQKKQQKLHAKEVRKQVRKVRRYEQQTDSARSAAGGFAAAMMLAVCLIVVIIPALRIDKKLVIKVLDDKISYARAYVTAVLEGNGERLDELEYEMDQDNFTPHSTELEHVQFDGTEIFRLESQYPATFYLRGWIGADYHDGAWYPSLPNEDDPDNPSALDTYRRLWGLQVYQNNEEKAELYKHPSDRMFYDFYWLMHEDLEVFEKDHDFLNKYHKYQDYGFAATTVHLRRKNIYSSLLYLPNVYDPTRGLGGYGNTEPSDHTFVNYFDGILTGRDFKEPGTEYSSVALAPIVRTQKWIDILSADITDFNLQKELILAYSSYEEKKLDSGYAYVETSYKVKVNKDKASGLTTITYYKTKISEPVAVFVHLNGDVDYFDKDSKYVLRDRDGNAYEFLLDNEGKIKSVSTVNDDSFFSRYMSGSEDDRKEIDRILFGGSVEDFEKGTNYTDFVYKYYTAKSGSNIIADLADEIYKNATYKEKVPTGEYEHFEAVTHDEYYPIGTKMEIDFALNTYYIKELDENGAETGEYIVCENANESMMANLYEKVTVVDEEAYDEPIYEIVEHPYDFSSATLQNAVFDTATAHRNDLVRAVIDYIIDDLGCEYSLTPDLSLVDPSLDGVENFLTKTKQGYCVQYATAVCLILREYGIPARYIEGYAVAEYSDANYAGQVARNIAIVKDYAAHAWIEVFFDGIGWVQYECTPAYYANLYGGNSQAQPPSDQESEELPPPPTIKDEIDDLLKEPETDEEEQMSKEELAAEEERRQAIIFSIVFVSVAAVAVAVIAVLVYLKNRAASAEYKRSSAADTVLAEYFGQNTSEDDRKELSYTVIDALHNILEIYGLAPETGEFKDEYARRLAIDLEDVLGRSPEYEQPDPDADPNAPAPAPLPVSPHRMGEIMDAIAAEEFGHGMSIAQMKQVSALYKDLRANVHKRVPFGRRMVLRYFKNRL